MKALALDMDGTILDHNAEFPLTLSDTLAELKEKGMHIFIATGRTSHEILAITPDNCPLDGYVAASGMGVYVEGRQIQSTSFSPDTVERIIDEARRREIYYEVHTLENSSRTHLQDKGYTVRDFNLEKPDSLKTFEINFTESSLNNDTQWVDELPYEDVVKMFFFSIDSKKIGNWYDFLASNQESSDYALYTTSVHNAELMKKGKDKATGIEVLLEHYDLDFSEVHAIGDSMNDLPMFARAGKSTAMKNADDDIKSAADEVTDYTCDADGLENYLRKEYL
ncbi:Cof-type HAD-IIB family hydrolase [Salinicoccus sp. HZC-1]|uniref:Cof-type HAD-IIB family hydrolase n=1 Tax=Salinicoccus sp. HZC-1 TaxID=3385497 RepID=UPI00398B7798